MAKIEYRIVPVYNYSDRERFYIQERKTYWFGMLATEWERCTAQIPGPNFSKFYLPTEQACLDWIAGEKLKEAARQLEKAEFDKKAKEFYKNHKIKVIK